MAHEVETMFSAREVPWHRLGTVTPDVLTAKEALVAGGLDWDVKMVPTYAGIGKNKVKIADRRAMVRSSDDAILGTAGMRYVPLQNEEAFTFLDNLVDSGDAKYETAGSLRNGKVVFISMKVPGEMLIGGKDPIDLYMLLRNTHDGSKALGVYLTPIRVVCMNTLSMALSSVKQRWEIRHIASAKDRMVEAREALNLTFAYRDEFVVMGDKLVETKVTDAMLKDLLETVLPVRPKTDEVITDVVALFNDSPTNGFAGTGWGAFNAITEYFDHIKESRSDEARFQSIIDGEAQRVRNAATKLLLSV